MSDEVSLLKRDFDENLELDVLELTPDCVSESETPLIKKIKNTPNLDIKNCPEKQ
jgi:hypothetical protein